MRGYQYRFNVNQVCENFRVAAAAILAERPTAVWEQLDGLAASMLQSLYRQLKVSNMKVARRHCAQRTNMALVNVLGPFFDKVMDMPVADPVPFGQKQPGRGAGSCRPRGNQGLRQIEIEVGKLHSDTSFRFGGA